MQQPLFSFGGCYRIYNYLTIELRRRAFCLCCYCGPILGLGSPLYSLPWESPLQLRLLLLFKLYVLRG